jgi:trehalose synthase
MAGHGREYLGGRFLQADEGRGIGLMYRPIVAQVSRWDHLKGWAPLFEGFLRFKRQYREKKGAAGRRHHRVEIARLILAGPGPSVIQDDPEGQEVMASLCTAFCGLKPEEQESVRVFTEPFFSKT